MSARNSGAMAMAVVGYGEVCMCHSSACHPPGFFHPSSSVVSQCRSLSARARAGALKPREVPLCVLWLFASDYGGHILRVATFFFRKLKSSVRRSTAVSVPDLRRFVTKAALLARAVHCSCFVVTALALASSPGRVSD